MPSASHGFLPPEEVWALNSLEPLRSQVHVYVEKLTRPYIDRLTKSPTAHFAPEFHYPGTSFHDPVWGPIRFNGAETLLIDSPILQRLRKIKQLGLADLVYFGASATRLEHSVGVTYVARRMAESIIEKELALSSNAHSDDAASILRLAALFHDSGHLFFSHTGEKFFTSQVYHAKFSIVKDVLYHFTRDIREISNDFPNLGSGDEANKKLSESGPTNKEVQLADLLSCLILTSPAVKELLVWIIERGIGWSNLKNRLHMTSAEAAKKIAAIASCFILGLPVNKDYSVYSQILTGGLDADKCDYLLRDSRYTRIPVALDVERVIAKLCSGETPAVSATTRVWQVSDIKARNLAVEYPAARTVGELVISRALMFEKVYHHQKVLALEGMVFRALKSLLQAAPDYFASFTNILALTDDDFTSLEPGLKLKARFDSVQAEIKDHAAFQEAIRLLTNLAVRNLPVRCCALTTQQTNNTLSNSETNQEIKQKFRRFLRAMEHGSPRKTEVESEIEQEIILLWTALHGSEVSLPEPALVMSTNGYSSDIGAPINFPIKIGDDLHYNFFQFSPENWAEGNTIVHGKFYFFAPRCYRPLAYIACENVLHTTFEIPLPLASLHMSKIDPNEYKKLVTGVVDRHRSTLNNRERLKLVLEPYTSDLEKLVDLFRQELDDWKKLSSSKDALNRLLDFLLQFRDFPEGSISVESFYCSLINLLQKIKFFNVGFFEQQAKYLGDSSDWPADGILVPLGGLNDSAAALSRVCNPGEGSATKHSMEALGKILKEYPGRPLIFFDDATNTGRQVVDLFQAVFNISVEKRLLNENHGLLSLREEAQINDLKTRDIYLFFVYSTAEAQSLIRTELDRLGLTKIHFLGCDSFPPKIFSASSLSTADHAVRQAFQEIGRVLLQPKLAKNTTLPSADQWNEDKINHYSLGYGDAQQLIVFPGNTPSYTLTALWREGMYKDRKWKPLFLRREKA